MSDLTHHNVSKQLFLKTFIEVRNIKETALGQSSHWTHWQNEVDIFNSRTRFWELWLKFVQKIGQRGIFFASFIILIKKVFLELAYGFSRRRMVLATNSQSVSKDETVSGCSRQCSW